MFELASFDRGIFFYRALSERTAKCYLYFVMKFRIGTGIDIFASAAVSSLQ